MNGERENQLSREEQTDLLRIARETIQRATQGKKPRTYERRNRLYWEKRGAFVSLHIQSELRGCIGYVAPVKSLLETIIEMAEAAAMRDPRFSPVSRKEVERLEIEISVLSPLILISDTADIIVGKHGLMIENDYNSGLLLPQVATAYSWDAETFLDHTCLKAGLAKSAWREKDTKIHIFTAQIFSEADLGLTPTTDDSAHK
jgi:AmmeMemoRadiSam system protein A